MNANQLVLAFISLCVVTLLLLILHFGSSYMNVIETKHEFLRQGSHALDLLSEAENQVHDHVIENRGDRTLEDLIPRLTSPVMLSMTNAGYMTLAENTIASVTRLSLTYDIVLICEDDISFDYFKNRTDIYVTRTNFTRNISAPQAYRSKLFEELVDRKAFYVMALIKSGIDVFYVDSDFVFAQDPNPHLRYDFDVIAIDEDDVPYCPGAFYIRSTDASKRMLLTWESLQSGEDNNQIAFNKAMHLTDGLTITRFDPYLFPMGRYVPRNIDWRKMKPPPVAMHFNGALSAETKIKRIKEAKVWYVKTS